MAINIKFDLAGNPEPPTIVLANRSGNKLGQLDVNTESIELSDKFNDASEFTFTLNKYVNGEVTNLWDKVVDFKLVYCKEWDMWFEIKVELDEATETIKTVFCTQLGQAELSQIVLYNIEINTEKDIERDDYKITILYDENDKESSLLDRLLEKAPHYSIAYVDPTIKNIQRTFSFDGTSIQDAFQEISEEIGCLFVYNSNSDENGMPKRTISVYDLQQNCNSCGYRGEYTDVCPECKNTNITYGYGKDTLIFVTSDELASDGIQLVTDTDSVKNCFKLEAGDDLMTATIRNCNPNGTDYIWYFSDSMKEDMSDALVEKLESYDGLYEDYYNNYESNIDGALLNKYNNLVTKYSVYNENLQTISTPIKGYSALMNAHYNTIDLALYLESGLMPSVEMSDTNAEEQASLLTTASLSPVAVADITVASEETVNIAVLAMAKIIVKSTYKVEIKTSEITNSGNRKYWKGNFIVTNYSNEDDTAESNVISVGVDDDVERYAKQKIEKVLNREDTDDLSVSGLFEKDNADFVKELNKYALNPLVSFREACQSCLDILIDEGAGNLESDLYDGLYLPYYEKLGQIEAMITIRENEINTIKGVYDADGILIVEGLQTYIEKCRNEVQNALNFEDYLGNELWLEFCCYRREDKYSNDNYISDGLNNAEIFEKALEFIDVAENEIYKSAELQHSISTTLNNLLAIDKFKPLIESFKVGNWIRVQVDDNIYKLRLLEYDIDYGDFDNISVEFSDVTKIKNGITDVESILSQASSMASSYDSTQRQAKQGDEAQGTIDQWIDRGLNSALVQIQNNDNEEITITKNGLLGRSYDELTDTYSPEQFRLTHNIMAYTTNNWETVSAALGKHEYTKWEDNQWVKDVDYGLTSKFVNAGYVTGSQIIGGEIVSSNYKSGESGTYFNLIDGDFEIAGGNIVYDTSDKALTLRNVTIEWSNSNAPEVTVNDITGIDEYLGRLDNVDTRADEAWELANSAKSVADNAKDIGDKLVNGLGFKETEITGSYVISPVIAGGTLLIGDTSSTYAQITTGGKLICVGATIKGEITAETGTIGGWTISESKISAGDGDTVKTAVMQAPSENITWVFAAGGSSHSSYADCPFRVDKTGNLYASSATINGGSLSIGGNFSVTTNGTLTASGATINGEITAETGTIGGWTIKSNKIYAGDGTTVKTAAVQAPSESAAWIFAAGGSTHSSYADCPFRVSKAGVLYATDAVISGDITATRGNFSDSVTIGGTEITAGALKDLYSYAIGGTGTEIKQISANAGYIAGWTIQDTQLYYNNGVDNYITVGKDGIQMWKNSDSFRAVNTDDTGLSISMSVGSSALSLSDGKGVLSGTWTSTSDITITSDINHKRSIESLDDKYSILFDSLSPTRFKYNDGTSNRYHTGFIAQDVENSILNAGLTTQDFAAFVTIDKDTENAYNGLRYTEFVALNTWEIQKLKKRVEELEVKLGILE